MNAELRRILPVIWVGGAAILLRAVLVLTQDLSSIVGVEAIWFTLLLVLAIITEMKPVPYALGRAHKDESLTITIILLALFQLGWPEAVLLAALSVVVADVSESKPYYKVLFNGSMYVTAATAAGLAYQAGAGLLALLHPPLPPIWMSLPVWLLAGAAYYLVNVAILMLVLSRVQNVPYRQMVVWGLRDSAMVNLALISIAMAMAALWEFHPLAAVILVPPILMAKVGYQGYTRLHSEAEALLATLADFLDLRDHNTGQHSARVAEMSYGLARLLGQSEDEALAIMAIARVHDVGKVVVRDAVLLKPGVLSQHERQEVQAHVEAGGRILSNLSVYRPQLSVLLQHHERWDGRGYPAGLSAEAITLGARILAVCDAYDTMISERPYRSAATKEAALAELYRNAGTQFDPAAVEALEHWLIREGKLRADWRSRIDAAVHHADLTASSGRPPAPFALGLSADGGDGERRSTLDQTAPPGHPRAAGP